MERTHLVAAIAFTAVVLSCSPAGAWDQDFWEQYLQRTDTVTLQAGNAKQANAVTQIITPWPRYVGDRRIPGNGERMSGAVERYRDVSKLRNAPPTLSPIFGTQVGTVSSATSGGGTGAGGAGATPQ